MINIKNQIPSIYYDASRDFQVLGHLFEVVLNYSKTNADMMYLLPSKLEADTRATELLALSLGFKLKRNYDKDQLAALVSIFPQLLKIKGTLRAVDLAGNALVKAAGVPGTFACELADHILTIKIPQELSDITLFLDLLPYIIPFGIRVSIIRTTVLTQRLSTEVSTATTMRKVLAGNFKNMTTAVHPLGLAKLSEDGSKVEHSSTGVIVPNTQEAAVGLLATSPIITFEPSGTATSAIITDEEEDT